MKHPSFIIPPWHTLVFLGAMGIGIWYNLPSSTTLDEIATPETLLRTKFPNLLSSFSIALIRIVLGSIMIVDSLYAFVFGTWDHETTYFPHSQLSPTRLRLRGLYHTGGSLLRAMQTLSYFTMWVFLVEGCVFLALGLVTLCLWDEQQQSLSTSSVPKWLLRTVVAGWEMIAPNTMVVSAVVKYVVWPANVAAGPTNAAMIQTTAALLEHNLNFLACLWELTLGAGLPVRYPDAALAAAFGWLYLLFSYAVQGTWKHAAQETVVLGEKSKPRDCGPQFLYDFLDPTLGWQSTLFLALLLIVLTLAYLLFAGLHQVLKPDSSLWANLAAIVVLTPLVCRFW